MNCERCAGACCESITIPLTFNDSMMQHFLELRTTPLVMNGVVQRNFDCRCKMLTPEGRCAIYTQGRPQVCIDFRPGSPECIATARMRRTEAQFERIRDPEDEHYDGRKDVVLTAEAFAEALKTMAPVTTTDVPSLKVERPC